jgi:hypothetical protein
LIGKKVNGFKILEKIINDVHNRYKCQCKCGNIFSASIKNLRKQKRGHCIECHHANEKTKSGILIIKKAKEKKVYECKCPYCKKIFLTTYHKATTYKSCGCAARMLTTKANQGSNHWAWNPNREEVAFNRLIHVKCKSMVRRVLHKINQKKESKSEILLGYTKEQLMERLNSFKSFEKLKKRSWHLDHIFPVKAFLNCGIYDVSVISSLDNLQPLEHIENIKKSDKYDKLLFEKYLINHNIIL